MIVVDISDGMIMWGHDTFESVHFVGLIWSSLPESRLVIEQTERTFWYFSCLPFLLLLSADGLCTGTHRQPLQKGQQYDSKSARPSALMGRAYEWHSTLVSE